MALGTSARGQFSEPQPDCPIVASFRSCINGTSPGTEGSVVNSPRGRGDLAVGIACDPRYPRRRPGHRIGPVAPSRLVMPSTPSSAPANADDAVLTDPDLVRWDRDEIHTSPLDAPSMAASGRVSHGSNRHCDALRDSRIPDYRVTPAAELTLCLHDGKPIRPCRSARHALQLITSRRRPCSVPSACCSSTQVSVPVPVRWLWLCWQTSVTPIVVVVRPVCRGPFTTLFSPPLRLTPTASSMSCGDPDHLPSSGPAEALTRQGFVTWIWTPTLRVECPAAS